MPLDVRRPPSGVYVRIRVSLGATLVESSPPSPHHTQLLILAGDHAHCIAGAARDYPTNAALQAFAQTRLLRLALLQYFTSDSAVDPFGDAAAATQDFYAVSALQVVGRPNCNGHASATATSGGVVACLCQHNTTGVACTACLPLFNRKPWARGINDTVANECVTRHGQRSSPACLQLQRACDSVRLQRVPRHRAGVTHHRRWRHVHRLRRQHGVVVLLARSTRISRAHTAQAGQHCEACARHYYPAPNVSRSDRLQSFLPPD